MSNYLTILLAAFMVAVFVVLIMGMFNLAIGGKNSAERSNKFMRYRVILQAVALAVLGMLFVLGKK